MPPVDQARSLTHCTPVGGQTYCLGLGFMESPPDFTSLVAVSSAQAGPASGDLEFSEWMQQRLAMPTDERVVLEQQEFADAFAAEDKSRAVLLALDLIEAGQQPGSLDTLAAVKASNMSVLDDPAGQFNFIMHGKKTQQNASNWCGPATFQMMAWGRPTAKKSQKHWRVQLGTGAAGGSGTAITSMVSLTNSATTWDNAAGRYITQSVATWNADKFWGVHIAHLGDGTPAPIIEHPKLLASKFKYLNYNGSGHFQVGRGYQRLAGSSTRHIAIFEPWNEARWYGNGNVTWGPQLVPTARLLEATKLNTNFKNIGL